MSGKRASADPRLAGAYRHDTEGWCAVSIHGAARDRGFQHGYLLAGELRKALREIDFLLRLDTGVGFDWFAENAARMYMQVLPGSADGFGDEILAELEGIVEGANAAAGEGDRRLTLAELLGWNGYPEMICQWWPAVRSVFS